jgi:hypothetical protein
MNVNTEDTPIDVYDYVFSNDDVVRSLSPISHEFEEGLYRVPVRIEGEKHTIYVGDNHKRMFDADTLPAFIKHKLAMIIVSATPESLVRTDIQLTNLELYATPKAGSLQTVGWRASQSMYIVVMSEEELDSLRGN